MSYCLTLQRSLAWWTGANLALRGIQVATDL